MKQGINIVGRLSGVAVEPWARDGKAGLNMTVGISRTFVDRFGAEESETIGVDVRGDELQRRLQDQAEKLRGKLVSLHVRAAAFAGRNGAFVKFSAVPDADLVPVITSTPAAAPAAGPARPAA